MSNKKYCMSCGARLSKDYKICRWCGADVNKPSSNNIVMRKNNNKKITIIIFFFFLIMTVYVLSTATIKFDFSESDDNVDINESLESQSETDSNLNKMDLNLRANFIKSCEEIKMNPKNIKSLKKIKDWNSGPRYSFIYEANSFTLYAYDTGEISSINVGNVGEKIYDERYESLDVNDFLVNKFIISDLQFKIEDVVKQYVNYPRTINFDWGTTGEYSRKYDFYFVNVNFSAENAFGVRSDHLVTAEILVNSGNYIINCLKIDSSIVYGTSKYKEIKRVERIVFDESIGDKIILKYGVKGKYGKEDLFDGEKYIRYYLPEGTYEVKALTRNANIMIESIKLHKENGYDTSTLINNIKLLNVGDVTTFKIKSSECITIVMNTKVELTLKN